MGKLFELPEISPDKSNAGINVKLKKGQTVLDLIREARELVMEKLGNYKDASRNITTKEELIDFFNNANELISIDTETTGLNTYSDELVGISLCNEKQSVYIPINHRSIIYNTLIQDQIPADDVKAVFKEYAFNPKFKWIYHNAKFDLSVFRTFLGFTMPDPFWDTMLAGNLLFQDEEHSLKYLYNKYIAEEDEGVNKFDTLFKRNYI